MSRAVRIREHLYAEIAKRAEEEHRSIIGQLELLLEQALKLDGSLPEREHASEKSAGEAPAGQSPVSVTHGAAAGSPVAESVRARSESDQHFKPDPKGSK